MNDFMLYIVTSDYSGGAAVGIMHTTSETTFHASRILIRPSEIPASVQLTNDPAVHPGTVLVRETHPHFGGTVTATHMEGSTLVLQGKPEGKHVGNSTNASYVYYDGQSPQMIKRTGGKRKVEIVVGHGCEYAVA